MPSLDLPSEEHPESLKTVTAQLVKPAPGFKGGLEKGWDEGVSDRSGDTGGLGVPATPGRPTGTPSAAGTKAVPPLPAAPVPRTQPEPQGGVWGRFD